MANKVLMIQATGDYQGALNLIKQYVVETESMKIMVDKLSELPIDIKPVFEIEQ